MFCLMLLSPKDFDEVIRAVGGVVQTQTTVKQQHKTITKSQEFIAQGAITVQRETIKCSYAQPSGYIFLHSQLQF